MTAPEQPRPLPGDLRATAATEGRVRYTRRFDDAAGRPMTGTVTLTPQPPGAPVNAEVREGVLDLELAPGVYTLVALLRTADLTRHLTMDTITITS